MQFYCQLLACDGGNNNLRDPRMSTAGGNIYVRKIILQQITTQAFHVSSLSNSSVENNAAKTPKLTTWAGPTNLKDGETAVFSLVSIDYAG
jgi:hypothetical protein